MIGKKNEVIDICDFCKCVNKCFESVTINNSGGRVVSCECFDVDFSKLMDMIDLASENERLHMTLCNSRVQAHNEVITRLRQLGERLKCKVLPFRCEGYAIHPFFFEIDKIVEEFIDSYERKN